MRSTRQNCLHSCQNQSFSLAKAQKTPLMEWSHSKAKAASPRAGEIGWGIKMRLWPNLGFLEASIEAE